MRDWESIGLDKKPDLFPMQSKLEGGKKYGNFLRLPGRHHTYRYHTRAWTGEKWAKGDEAIDLILATEGVSPDKIPPIANPAPEKKPATDLPLISPVSLERIQKHALALLKTRRAELAKKGDKWTWWAALLLVKDLALTPEQAKPVLLEWNRTNCLPPWEEKDLIRKLRLAEQEPGPRGGLLKDVLPESMSLPVASHQPDGSAFCFEVPDSVVADWRLAAPRRSPKKRGRSTSLKSVFYQLCRALIVLRRATPVLVPDVVIAQLLWGGDRKKWPARWRREAYLHYRRLINGQVKQKGFTPECLDQCPLHGREDMPHNHLSYRIKDEGCLRYFRVSEGEGENGLSYDFKGLQSHHQDPDLQEKLQLSIDSAKRAGCLWSIYLPAWIFGPLCLGQGPSNVLKALTHEVTRTRSRSQRPDRAEIVRHDACPFLERGKNYVGFNGNAKPNRKVQGYRLKTWLHFAGYEKASLTNLAEPYREFLNNLHSLSGDFGLTVGGYRTDLGEWQPMNRLLELSQSTAGLRWLDKCVVWVYAPEDYLTRWRGLFATKMGFFLIPGGDVVVTSATSMTDSTTHITSALELCCWLRQNGMTARALAEALGVSAATVSYYVTGRRPLSLKFRDKLEDYLRLKSEVMLTKVAHK